MMPTSLIIKNYLDDQYHQHNINTHNYNEQIIKHNLQKLKCHISNDMKRHQMKIIRPNRKLNFYSSLANSTFPRQQMYLRQKKAAN